MKKTNIKNFYKKVKNSDLWGMKMLLEDCCDILDSMRVPITASNRKKGPYPYYGANGVQDYVADYIFDDELVLLAEDGGNFGSKEKPIAYRVSGKCWINNHAHVLKPKAGLNVDYLCYSLMFYNTDGLVNGATRQKLTQAIMRKMLIPERNMNEQLIIVEELNKITKILLMRKTELQTLDNLIKARFVEMFGEPVNNPKGWEMVALGKRCEIITGNTPSRAEPENYGEFIEWIKSDNINTPNTFLTEAQEYLSEIGFQKCRFVEAGSLLMTCIAGSINCIGNVAVTDRRVAFNQQINAIVPKEDEVFYLYWLMILSKPAIHSTINMALKGILSKGQLSEIVFPFPPATLQKQFAAFVTQTSKSKAVVQKALDETQLLFDSLMQKYFG